MRRKPPIAAIGFFVAVTLAGAGGLLAMAGAADGLSATPLKARVVLQDFPLPQGFGLEPKAVSDFLVGEMQKRTLTDVALRITLGSEGQKNLHDVVIPRLLNAGVIRKMITDVQPLADVLAIGHFVSTAEITVRNQGSAALGDVAMTLPNAARAEDSEGVAVPVVDTADGIKAINLGNLAPGAERRLTVWRDGPADFSDAGLNAIALGAAGPLRGQVSVFGERDWFGAGLEAARWARWLVAGLLAGVTACGLFGLVAALRRLLPQSATSLRDVSPTKAGS